MLRDQELDCSSHRATLGWVFMVRWKFCCCSLLLCVAAALKLQESDEERETAHIAYICGMIEALTTEDNRGEMIAQPALRVSCFYYL